FRSSEAPAVVVGGAGDVLVRLEPGEREGLPAGLEALACQPVRGPRFVELCAVAVVAVGERGPPVVEVAAESLAGTGGAVPARRADGVLDGAGQDPRDGSDDEQRNDHGVLLPLLVGQ